MSIYCNCNCEFERVEKHVNYNGDGTYTAIDIIKTRGDGTGVKIAHTIEDGPGRSYEETTYTNF